MKLRPPRFSLITLLVFVNVIGLLVWLNLGNRPAPASAVSIKPAWMPVPTNHPGVVRGWPLMVEWSSTQRIPLSDFIGSTLTPLPTGWVSSGIGCGPDGSVQTDFYAEQGALRGRMEIITPKGILTMTPQGSASPTGAVPTFLLYRNRSYVVWVNLAVAVGLLILSSYATEKLVRSVQANHNVIAGRARPAA